MESDDTRKFDEFDDLLSRYLKGQLSEEEEAEFHRLISDDAELHNKAVATARLARAMEQAGPECDRAIIDAIKTLTLDQAEDLADNNSERFWFAPPKERILCSPPDDYFERRDKRHKKRKPCKFVKFAARLSAAAAILACLWGGYRVFIYEPRQVAPSIQPEVRASIEAPQYIRGEGDSIGMKLNELYYDIVLERQLPDAIRTLETMWIRSRLDTYNDCTEHMPEIGLLLTHAYIKAGYDDRALEVIDLLLSDYPAESAVGNEALEMKGHIEER